MTLITNQNVVAIEEYIESLNSCYLVMEYCRDGDLECKFIYFSFWFRRNKKKIVIISRKKIKLNFLTFFYLKKAIFSVRKKQLIYSNNFCMHSRFFFVK